MVCGRLNQQGTQRWPFQTRPQGQCAPRPRHAAGLIGVKDCAAAPTLADPGATIASARHTDAVANRIAAVSPSVMIFDRICRRLRLEASPLSQFDQRIGHAKVTSAVNRTQEVANARSRTGARSSAAGFFAGTIISGYRRVLSRFWDRPDERGRTPYRSRIQKHSRSRRCHVGDPRAAPARCIRSPGNDR